VIARGRFDRLVAAVEGVAAALLALVTALTFLGVVLRYVFRTSIPDGFDVGRMLMGAIIFWGIALAGYRGDHIAVDLAWSSAPMRWKRLIDLFAGTVTLVAMTAFFWMFGDKVLQTLAANLRTYDLRLPVWPFYALCWAGLASAVVLLILRLWRIATGTAFEAGPAYRD